MPLSGGQSVEKENRKPSTFWVSLTSVEEPQDGVLSGVPENHGQAHGSQAERHTVEAEAQAA
jgi:hypothetical protein